MLRKHLFAYLLPNLSQAIASFGTVAVLTRLLTGAEYGRFSLVTTILSTTHYAFLTWAEAAAARFFAEAREEGRLSNHFKTLLVSMMFNCILFIIASVLITIFYPADRNMKIAFAAAFGGAIARNFLRIGLETRRMKLQSMRYALAESAHILIGFVLTIIGVWKLGFREEGAFIATMIAAMIIMAIETPALIAEAKGGSFEKEYAKTYFRYGFPISVGLILNMALSMGDRFLISIYLDDNAVGVYSAGYQVAARILEIVFTYAASATFPLLVNAFETKDAKIFDEAARNSFNVRMSIAAPAAVGIILVVHPLSELLIGPALRNEAIKITPWIVIAGVLFGLSEYFSEPFVLSKRVIERAILLVTPAVLNIGLNMVLLPKMGLQGAVISTLVAYFISTVLLAIRGRKYVKMPIPYMDTLKIAVACLMMSIAVSVIPEFGGIIELSIKASIGGLAYGLMAIAFNVYGARDKISSILKRRA